MKRLLICWFSLCLTLCVSAYIPTVYYMDEECNFQLNFSPDIRMKLTYYSSYLKRNMNCSVTLKTNEVGDTLLVQYRSLNTKSSYHCEKNRLRILNSERSAMNGPYGDCGPYTPTTSYITSGRTVTFIFTTDNSFQTGHFDILITSFSVGNNNTCPTKDLFHCKNNRCISQKLHCNGYNDCGDRSDEHCPITVGAIVGIAIAVVFFSILCVIFSLVARARRRRYHRMCETHRHQVVHTTTATTFAPPPYGKNVQQPSYQSYGK